MCLVTHALLTQIIINSRLCSVLCRWPLKCLVRADLRCILGSADADVDRKVKVTRLGHQTKGPVKIKFIFSNKLSKYSNIQ